MKGLIRPNREGRLELDPGRRRLPPQMLEDLQKQVDAWNGLIDAGRASRGEQGQGEGRASRRQAKAQRGAPAEGEG